MSTMRFFHRSMITHGGALGGGGTGSFVTSQHLRQMPASLMVLCSSRRESSTDRRHYFSNFISSNSAGDKTTGNSSSTPSTHTPATPFKWPVMLGRTMANLSMSPHHHHQRFSTKSTATGNSTTTTTSSPSTHPSKTSEANTRSTSASAAMTDTQLFGETSNLGLFAKFKLMYKKYWYVLIPVHVVTSVGWFGGFYYLCKSGVDVPSLLQYMHLSESIIENVKGSEMGNIALAYLCYKVATPLRYAVTLGGTTVSIKYLVQAGHIKPMPSKQELIDLYEQKKADRAAAKVDKVDKTDKTAE